MERYYRSIKVDDVKAATAGEYFGTLQQSVTEAWRHHLKTAKYSAHMALDEYYTEAPEKIDALIEAYIAEKGEKIMDYKCNIKASSLTPLEYLRLIKSFAEAGREEYCMGKGSLNSLLDDFLALVDSTIYKLKELHESDRGFINLSDFIIESLGEEM